VRLQAAKPKGDKAKRGPVPQLQLLHNITGSFRPGILTALMGVSGVQPSLALRAACMRQLQHWPCPVCGLCCYPVVVHSLGHKQVKPPDVLYALGCAAVPKTFPLYDMYASLQVLARRR
jgi:hypothetical protein